MAEGQAERCIEHGYTLLFPGHKQEYCSAAKKSELDPLDAVGKICLR